MTQFKVTNHTHLPWFTAKGIQAGFAEATDGSLWMFDFFSGVCILDAHELDSNKIDKLKKALPRKDISGKFTPVNLEMAVTKAQMENK